MLSRVELVEGIYETLITGELQRLLDGLAAEDLLAAALDVDVAEQPAVLGEHVGRIVERVLASVPDVDRVAVTNRVLAAVLVEAVKHPDLVEKVEPGPRQLAEEPVHGERRPSRDRAA